MTADGHETDSGTSVAATNVAATSRTTAPPAMTLAEKLEKFSGIDFKWWQQKILFYLTTLCLQRFIFEDAPELSEETSDKERFVVVEV
ncbi:hypothetical protein P3S68_016601 [Capsicum galapagoense]